MFREDAESVTLLGPLRAEIGPLKRAVDFDHLIGGSNPGHVFVTPEEVGRKSDDPRVFAEIVPSRLEEVLRERAYQ